MRFFLSHDPVPTARRVSGTPVLILIGENDQHATADQAGELAAALASGGNGDVTARVFPGLNHLFITDSIGMPAGYRHLKRLAMETPVVGAVVDWVRERLK